MKLIRTLIIVGFAFLIGYLFGIKEVRFFEIISSSMEPTLSVGDRIVAIKPSNVQRKDIVVIKDPEEGKDILTKRVIGLPGETIEIRNGYVYINGKRIDEPYIKEKPVYNLKKKIPGNSYFLLGDNRNESEDSSVWGPVKKKLIIGKVLLRYYPFKKISLFLKK